MIPPVKMAWWYFCALFYDKKGIDMAIPVQITAIICFTIIVLCWMGGDSDE
jgi:hypothetical protein|nr:MAG TPA: hypothetical protein [Caudoviricetes sp.]